MPNIGEDSVHCETSGCFSQPQDGWREFVPVPGVVLAGIVALFAATLEFKTAGLFAIIL
jgi:hypothetical protein